MCLIERLPAIEINKPLAWTGGTYYGIGPMKVERRRGGKRHNRKQTPVAAATPKKVPVLAFLALEADMSLPARQMHANIVPMREPYYNNGRQSHHQKRMLQKHCRIGLRTISAMVSFLQ